MKVMRKIFAAVVLMSAIFVSPSFACTTFCLKSSGEILFGKNYDWMIGDGLLFVNKRGVSKTAMGDTPGTPNTATWTSKYGSVTFNQYGRENPSGGMNEAGLVIELMWLDETEWPKADSRPVVGTLEWIQYQLDSSATVADVIANAAKVRISSSVKIHYLVNDKSGNTATVEFLKGELAAHKGADLPVTALTNDTYDRSLSYSRSAVPNSTRTPSSLDRFARAAEASRRFQEKPMAEKEAVDFAFSILSDVAQKGYTQWNIVYDQKRGKIHFRTLKSAVVKTVDTAAFDYSCGSTVKLFDIDSADGGDVTSSFKDYSRTANRDLVERSYGGTSFLKLVPGALKDRIAAYPETFRCGGSETKSLTNVEGRPISYALAFLCPLYFVVNRLSS